MNNVLKASLWTLMLSLCACQALTGGDDFEVAEMNTGAITQAGVGARGPEPKAGTTGDAPKAGTAGDVPKAGSSGDPSAGSGGGGHAGEPVAGNGEDACERSISGAPCNLAPNCGCPDEKSCALTGANGSTPTLACVTPGPMGPGSVCTGANDCGDGLICLGEPRGVCRPYCDDDNDCFGDGICSPVLNKGVPLDGARACFQRCDSNDDCATDCCVANKCADAILCKPVALGGACATSSMCEGAATGDAACMGGICKAVCSANSDCSTNCCMNAMCVAESMCGGNVPIGEVCTRNGDCVGYASGESGCVSFTGQTESRCAAVCNANSECRSGCCAETDGPSFCGPTTSCSAPTPPPPPACRETGTTCTANGDCCDFASGGARCISLSDTESRCAATCDAHSDCQSGCCAETTSGNYVCGRAELCGT